MENIKRILAVWKFQTVIQICSKKTWIVLIMIFFYIRGYTEPVMDFSRAVHVKITPYLYPLFMNDWVFPVIIALGFLVLVCDAPFIQKGFLFLVARTGKFCWAVGQALFLLTFAISYTIVLCGVTVVNCLPELEMSSEWGKVIMTLVRTDASFQFQTMELSAAVAENYSALEALFKTLLLSALFFFFIGMVIFALNYAFKNHVGVIAAAILIFMDLAIYNLFSANLYRFSPASMMKLSVLAGVNRWSPTFAYACMSMTLGSIVFLIIVLAEMKWKKGIQMENRRDG